VDYHTKNSRSAELVPAPILPKMGRSRPKFPERCHPLTCPRVPNLVRIGCALLDLFRKDWFFGPKSHYNIRFQPTINVCTLADQHSTFVMLLIKESGKRTFGSTSTSLQADSYTTFSKTFTKKIHPCLDRTNHIAKKNVGLTSSAQPHRK